ncbi:hypothetical protein G6O67_008871 [Ophiocordyceps sinensis]|uniref:WSC domain-containing protein n=1 Tax=Ophiocordyceps sinensis TaxID=72228 RepID=A0A8H4LRW0_9HYPO|nr:hypothetical protein G6O67_008871 [Ophiocordyceps sinensis]
MKLAVATAIAALLNAAAAKDERTFAVLRFNNKQLTKGRMDPLRNPGETGLHVHNILGGSGFSTSSKGGDLQKSRCTTAKVKGDNSNYWFPSLYFKDPKTAKFEHVDVFYANAYYFFDATNDDIKAFPLGLGIFSGDSDTRSPPPAAGAATNLDPSKGPVNPVKWTCPRDGNRYDPPSWPADSDGKLAGIGDAVNKGEGVGFPDVNCDGFASPLRADIHFPSCYNPNGYIHVPHLFLEVYWNTPAFKDRWESGKASQPFVLSNGDSTGFSLHADFMSGWDEKVLQHIIDTCNAGTAGMDKCPNLPLGLTDDECTIESMIHEKVDGVLESLPGSNPLTGWAYGGANSSSPSPSREAPSTPSTSRPEASSQPTDEEDYPVKRVQDKPVRLDTGSSTRTAKHGATAVPKEEAPLPSAPAEEPSYPTAGTASQSSGPAASPDCAHAVTATDPAAPTVQLDCRGVRPAAASPRRAARLRRWLRRVVSRLVSSEKCVSHCKAGGFALAGTEYGGQCYCGNELVGSQRLDEGRCETPCEGDASQFCGGGWALSVYSKDGQAVLKGARSRRHFHNHMRRHRGRHS